MKGKAWTIADDAIMRERYAVCGDLEELAAGVGRSVQSIRVRAVRLKLKRLEHNAARPRWSKDDECLLQQCREQGMDEHEAAETLGRSVVALRKHIEYRHEKPLALAPKLSNEKPQIVETKIHETKQKTKTNKELSQKIPKSNNINKEKVGAIKNDAIKHEVKRAKPMAVQSKIVGGLLKIVTKYGKYYTGDNAVKITDNYIIIKV